MRHFLSFISIVFIGLFVARVWKTQKDVSKEAQVSLRVFGTSSFVSQWGPGPWIKEQFEKTCQCKVEFYDGADTLLLMQRLKSESRLGADVVLGFDQFDLELAEKNFKWNAIDTSKFQFVEEVKPWLKSTSLVPFDWGILAFVFRQSELKQTPKTLDDLLTDQFKYQIAMQDPRTSSPGLQFLLWLVNLKTEDGAFEFLKKFNKQTKSYSTSWSMAYGLFRKKQALTSWSYVTSPVYHQVEEKDSDVVAAEFNEGHPLQFEFVGIPSICKQCDLAQKFVQFLFSVDGQKAIMEKNYMFPSIQGVKTGTPFANVPNFKTTGNLSVPTIGDRERLLKRWSQVRRQD